MKMPVILLAVMAAAIGFTCTITAAQRGGRGRGEAATKEEADAGTPGEGRAGGRGGRGRGDVAAKEEGDVIVEGRGAGRGGRGGRGQAATKEEGGIAEPAEGRGGRGQTNGQGGGQAAGVDEMPATTQAAGRGRGRGARGGGRGAGRNGRGRGAASSEPAAGQPATTTPSAGGTGAVADRRESRQQHRIDEGIKHGQLTPDEVAKLEKQEADIKTLEDSFKADGTISKDEGQQLHKALNDASLQIWAQRHDTEGNQMPTLRLGKDVFATNDITGKIEDGTLTRPQARQFLEDLRKMVNIKHRLSSDTLTDDQRTKLQADYNTLLNQYFETR